MPELLVRRWGGLNRGRGNGGPGSGLNGVSNLKTNCSSTSGARRHLTLEDSVTVVSLRVVSLAEAELVAVSGIWTFSGGSTSAVASGREVAITPPLSTWKVVRAVPVGYGAAVVAPEGEGSSSSLSDSSPESIPESMPESIPESTDSPSLALETSSITGGIVSSAAARRLSSRRRGERRGRYRLLSGAAGSMSPGGGAMLSLGIIAGFRSPRGVLWAHDPRARNREVGRTNTGSSKSGFRQGVEKGALVTRFSRTSPGVEDRLTK